MNNNGSYNLSFLQNATGIVHKIGGSIMNVSKTIMQNLTRAGLAFAVCLLTLTPALALTNQNHILSSNQALAAAFEPSAVFKSSRIEYNVTEDGRRGMRALVTFDVTGLKGVDTKLIIRVQKGDNSFVMNQASYSNSEGQFEASTSIKPGYPTTEYEDLGVFIPYSELNLRKGDYNLRLDIDLGYENGDLIQHLTFKNFRFSAPNSASDSEERPDVTATVNRVWVDYDVVENRKKGMRIHINFEVTGLKGIDSKVTVRVRNENDELLSSESDYANSNGELELEFEMRPGYPTTVYKDATVFLPYEEINLRKGVWNLKLDFDLNYANGDIIDHLAFHEFEFTR